MEALQTADKYNVSIPANWINGDPFIQKVPKTYKELEERLNEMTEQMNGMNWYLTFKSEDDMKVKRDLDLDSEMNDNKEADLKSNLKDITKKATE